jgi:hypothetical protein
MRHGTGHCLAASIAIAVAIATWSGRAAEGMSLHYLVRASTDGGATWQTIGVDLSTPAIDLGPNDFGGQSVLVQVLASDGLRTASLRLGPFDVPRATVASP